MNLYELQERANLLVNKVNEYESLIPDEKGDETTILSQHKFADIFCLRAVMQYILGINEERKSNTTLNNSLPSIHLYYSTMLNQTSRAQFYNYISNLSFLGNNRFYGTPINYTNGFGSNQIYSYNYNMLVDNPMTSPTYGFENIQVVTGKLMSTSAIIRDAVITESQVVNLKNFNYDTKNAKTTEQDSTTTNLGVNNFGGMFLLCAPNNNYLISPTVPNDEDLSSTSINRISWGSPYTSTRYDSEGEQSQTFFITDDSAHSYRLKLFFNSATWSASYGVSTNTLQPVSQFFGSVGLDSSDSINIKNRPNKIYFELAFKNRRAGCKENNLDFVPAVDTSYDNDPQGLATRLALAQCKPYYYKRPWFNELDEYYSEEGKMQSELADLIEEKSKDMDDITFIKTYKLDYETYAKVTGDPL